MHAHICPLCACPHARSVCTQLNALARAHICTVHALLDQWIYLSRIRGATETETPFSLRRGRLSPAQSTPLPPTCRRPFLSVCRV